MAEAKNTTGEPESDLPPGLAELRARISEADGELVRLLNHRASLSMDVGRLKNGSPGNHTFYPGREAELLRGIAARNPGPLPEEHLRAIYRQILSSSRQLQRPLRVAFLGPEGTFSHLAAKSLLGSLSCFQARPGLVDVFQAVEEGDCDVGIIPLENSLQGTVGQSFDLFLQHKVYIRAESNFAIRHSLLSRCSCLEDIRAVYSHPQPLAQCGVWLRQHLPRVPVLPLESTAAAAGRCREEEGAAAIAHADLAETLGLHVLAQGIEDMPGNMTRFVLIGLTPADRPGPDKTSLLFTVADKPGSLSSVLGCFSRRGINMRKLESRPLRGEDWKYVFFADLECDIYDDACKGVLDEIAQHCFSLRVLGSYPSGF